MTQTFEQLEKAFGVDTVAEMRKEAENIEIKRFSSLDTEGVLKQN